MSTTWGGTNWGEGTFEADGGSGGGGAPVIVTFAGPGTAANAGDTVTLTWEITGTTTGITINGTPVTGTSLDVVVTSTVAFTLVAQGLGFAPEQTITVFVHGAAAENVRYHQIRRLDREGDGKKIQMSALDNPATENWPALYGAGENVIASQPRGNTTVAQMADQAAGYAEGHVLVFDSFGNAKSGGAYPVTTEGILGPWVEEIPVGTLNGVNLVFTMTYTPVLGSLTLFLNIQQREGADFTIAANTITFTVAPKFRDTGWFQARYQH